MGLIQGNSSIFKNLEATTMYGVATKNIDINFDPRPGLFFTYDPN